MRTATSSSRIREGLSHPVVDCDGHWTEPVPLWAEYVQKIAGGSAADTFLRMQEGRSGAWYGMSPAERLERRYWRPAWWGFPADTLDRATAMLPGLLYSRLDDFGIDFAVILPTRINATEYRADPGLRKAVVRAANIMSAEIFEKYGDRIAPAAVIPTNTPDEAAEEAEYAVRQLGFKAVVMNGSLRRPVAAFQDSAAEPDAVPFYIDTLGLDSPYDYDPLWEKLVELKVSPMSHSGSRGWPDRLSVTNEVFNHVGHFAQAGHSFARGLFLGGVTTRFPSLNFAFLEGGVAWGRSLCTDLAGHWDKRNVEALMKNLRPANLDLGILRDLITRHGQGWFAEHADELLANIDILFPGRDAAALTEQETDLDDFKALAVTSREAVAAEFAKNFHFGCEADDPLVSLAFDTRLGPRLSAMFGSDVSHFDVVRMDEVLKEAYELVEHQLLSMSQFRDFAFANAVRLHGRANPGFFDGTCVESAAREVLAEQGPSPS